MVVPLSNYLVAENHSLSSDDNTITPLPTTYYTNHFHAHSPQNCEPPLAVQAHRIFISSMVCNTHICQTNPRIYHLQF
jgi:hypothetical protein